MEIPQNLSITQKALNTLHVKIHCVHVKSKALFPSGRQFHSLYLLSFSMAEQTHREKDCERYLKVFVSKATPIDDIKYIFRLSCVLSSYRKRHNTENV